LLGALCVFDHLPRSFEHGQKNSFIQLGQQALLCITAESNFVAINKKASFYDTLLQSAEESIISTRPDGIITSFSVGAEIMLGYKADELIGKETPSILHDASEIINRAAKLSLTSGKPVQAGFEVFVINARNGHSDTSKWTYIRKDNTRLTVSLTVTAMFDEHDVLVGFLGIARDISESEKTKESLVTLADIFQRTGEMAKIGGWELDLLTDRLQWTDEVYRIHELEPPNIPSLDQALSYYPPDVRPRLSGAIENAVANGGSWDLELPFTTAKGHSLWVRAQGSAIMEQGRTVRLVGAFQNITDRKQSELDLAWVNRALLMLGKCNETLIHIADEMHLLTEICRIAVDVGGYRMAWIGYADDAEYQSVIPRAHFGKVEDFLDHIRINWSKDQIRGQIPCGKTMQNGQAIVIEDLLHDASYPVKDKALQLGYRALLSLPLKNKQTSFGLLALYLGEPHRFAKEEIRLLQDMADNLSAGILNIRAEKERQRLNAAMLTVATSVSVSSGETFFSQIVANMTNALGAQSGYVAQLVPGPQKKGMTLAAVVDNQIVENFEFSIPEAVAEKLFATKNLRIVPKSAFKDFPHISMMRFFNYQGFAGLCLYNSHEEPVGLMFVFFKDQILQSSYDLITSILKIFAARTVSELERQASAIAISENARFVKTITDAMPAMVAYWDSDLRCRFANKPYLIWFGKSPENIIGTSIQNLLGEALFNLNKPYIHKALAGESQQFERILTRADGTDCYTWANYIPDIDVTRRVNGFFVLVTDISPIKKAENDLRLAASVFQNTIEGIMVTDADGTILSVNPAFTDISGFSLEDAVGKTPRIFKSGRHDDEFYSDMWQAITSHGLWHGEVWNRVKSGDIHPDLMTITAVTNSDGKVSNYVGIFTDNTEYKKQEEQRLLEESLHRDTLVREVHHRIKNNLQSVASLLSNFATEYPELSDPINNAITQVKSIAVIHGLQGSYVNNAVRLDDLVKAIVGNNQALWHTHIIMNMQDDWPPIQIAEKEAVPLALVINELMLNAIKHGDKLKEISVTLLYDRVLAEVNVLIKNHGQLSLDEPVNKPNFGTGLQLVTSLLPKNNAILSWEQDEDIVKTRIVLSVPVILIKSVNEEPR